MILLNNIITIIGSMINNIIGPKRVYIIGYEDINEIDDDKYDPICQCNLCWGVRNFILFSTHRLKFEL